MTVTDKQRRRQHRQHVLYDRCVAAEEKAAAKKAAAKKAAAKKAAVEKAAAKKAAAEKAAAEKAAEELQEDAEHLIMKYHHGEWGRYKDILYTRDMSGLPDGRFPTLEVIKIVQIELENSGFYLAGRIIMTDNDIYDADSENKIHDITQPCVERMNRTLWLKIQWNRDNILNVAGCKNPHSITLENDVEVKNGPKVGAGVYKLLDGVKSNSGGIHLKFCDEPTCVQMSMLALNWWEHGYYDSDPEEKANVMNFLKTRPIYQREDPVHGNCDICYHCLTLAKRTYII